MNVTYYEYDRFGNVTKTTDAYGKYETATYNLAGLPVSTTDKKGVTTTYTYNAYGSPLTVSVAGMDTITYTYNVNNLLLRAEQGNDVITYEYDNLGRLTKETENGIIKTYQTDNVGNVTYAEIAGAGTTYTYDNLNRLTGVTFEGGSAAYTYDAAGRITSETKGGISTAYTYNQAGWLTNKSNTSDGQTTSYALTYFSDGNIASKTENGVTTNYVYDGLGQLISENDTTYMYDTRGNRIQMTSDNVVTDYRYDRTNKLLTMNTGDLWTAYAYDENGNNTSRESYTLTTENGTTNQTPVEYLTMTYDPLNRMTKAQKDGMTAEYTYGIDNMRKSKTVNGVTTNYLWDGGNIVAESDGNNAITNRYFRGIGLVASRTGDNLSYYQTDSHGDVSKWGAVDYSYDAFGNETTASNGANPFRYNGEYFDEETGFIYLRNRYYDPNTGRFINEDPIRDGLNWYAYCANNPVMFVDPWGLWMDGDELLSQGAQMYTIYYGELWMDTHNDSNMTEIEKQKKKDYYHALANDIRNLDKQGKISTVLLAVPNYDQLNHQNGEELCWAVAGSMLVSYAKGDTIDRTVEIAQKKANGSSDPNVYAQAQNWDQAYVSTYVDGFTSDLRGVLSQEQIIEQIGGSNPFVMKYIDDKKEAHVVLGVGYVYAPGHEIGVAINDPYEGMQSIQMYKDAKTYWDGKKWTYTYITTGLKKE